MPDRLRALQEDVLAAEEALDDDVLAERLLQKSRQGVAAERAGYDAPGQMSDTARWRRPR